MRGSASAAILLSMFVAGSAMAEEDDEVEPPEALVAEAPVGPAASVAALCKLVPADPGDDEEPTCEQTKMRPKLKAAAPYDAFALVGRENSTYSQHSLAIKMGTQWYLAPLVTWSTGGPDGGSLTIKTAKIKDVIPGGAPEILLSGVHTYDTEDDMYNAYGASYDALWVCSVGASGAPSCVEVPMGQRTDPGRDNGKPWKFRLGYKFAKDGKIVRTLKGKWPRRADTLDKDDYVNTRTLQFK